MIQTSNRKRAKKSVDSSAGEAQDALESYPAPRVAPDRSSIVDALSKWLHLRKVITLSEDSEERRPGFITGLSAEVLAAALAEDFKVDWRE